MMRTISKILASGGMLAMAFAATGAGAQTVLLNLINPATQTNTPYALSFTATNSATTLSVAGYQVPSSEQATQNAVRLGAGPNLLGVTWVYTPAPSGALSSQGPANAITGTNELSFAGVTTGSYDTYAQTFATAIGSVYTYSFLFSNSVSNSPSGFRVSVNAGPAGAVPEPATWAMMIVGAAAVGGTMRYRRSKVRTNVAFA